MSAVAHGGMKGKVHPARRANEVLVSASRGVQARRR